MRRQHVNDVTVAAANDCNTVAAAAAAAAAATVHVHSFVRCFYFISQFQTSHIWYTKYGIKTGMFVVPKQGNINN